jgi:hypothetical protein
MSATRLATGLTVALLALPATATAKPPSLSGPSLSDTYGWGQTRDKAHPLPFRFRYGAAGLPTSSLAGTTSPQDLRSPDAGDVARAGDIAKAMEHYQRSQPPVAVAAPSDDSPVWPEIAFAGVVLLATAGGVVRARVRRSRRVAA